MKILLVEDNVADAALLEKQLVETGAFEVNLQSLQKRCRSRASSPMTKTSMSFCSMSTCLSPAESSAVQGIQAACPNTPVLALSGEDNEIMLRWQRLASASKTM